MTATRRYSAQEAWEATQDGRRLRCVQCGWDAPGAITDWRDLTAGWDAHERISCWECACESFYPTAAPPSSLVDVWGADAMRAGFTAIPNTMFALGLQPGELLVVVALVKHLRRPGAPVFPSVKTIAGITGQSPKTVRNALAELRRRGLLDVERKRRQDGRMGVNRYALDGLRDALNHQGQLLPLDPGSPGATTDPTRGNDCLAEVDVVEEDPLPRRTTSKETPYEPGASDARAGDLSHSLDEEGNVVPFPVAEGQANGAPEDGDAVKAATRSSIGLHDAGAA